MADTVLIADGKGPRRRRLKALLSTLGYRVLATGSGTAALALAETARLQVVLMAARLPDMPAESLLQAIQKRNPDVTRLVLCEAPGEASRLKHAAHGFLLPPLHADVVEVVVRGACERGALRRRVREQPLRIERRIEKRFRKQLSTERSLVVKQIVDKISTFIGRIARDVEGGVRYFNEMPYFVSIHDRQARVIAASRPYRMLLGANAGDGSGSIYEGESGESGSCPVGRTLATANAQRSREVVRYRSGARVPVIVHTAPIYNDNGEVELVLEVSAGTQDVERLREDTQNTQQRYQLLFDAVPCYLAVLDRNLSFSANNRAFIHEFGNRTGTAFRDTFGLDDEAFLASPINKTLTDAQSRHGEMSLVGPNGRRFHLLVWTSPISTAAGKLMQVLLIFLDITQVRELQSHLASLGLMIGSISHSIKGVLTGLDAGVYLLDKGFQKRDDAQIESGLDVVRRMVNRMRKMILDILFCARERELQRTTVDIQAFADDAVELFDPSSTARASGWSATSKACRPPSMSMPTCCARRSSTCWRMPSTPVWPRGFTASRGRCCGSRPTRTQVEITVQDNGIGMSAEQLQNLFTIFFSTKGSQGTGLGLFLTDRIIRQHGGQIAVESRPGLGSRFRMTLPRHAADPAQKA